MNLLSRFFHSVCKKTACAPVLAVAKHSFLAATTAILTALGVSVQAQTVGTTPGQFSVHNGTASYTVPVAVPPGVAGMVPELSVQVSSPGSNGVAGLGGGLTGLSMISRCPATMAQDGFKGGIHFDGEDRYCLDGQRLIAIRGSNGANGSEYRTELDSLTKVVARGFQGSGPQWFEVWTKAGQRLEYGKTGDSRVILGDRTSVMTWTVNRIEDTAGNAITINYHADHAAGEHYPLEIRYAGNVVRFDYEERPDSFSGYRLGSPVQMTRRLSNIMVEAWGDAVREYRLEYHPADSATPSRLSSVVLCDGAGDCLLPVELAWSALDTFGYELEQREINYRGRTHSYSRTKQATTLFKSSEWGSDNPREFGDFNGDGYLDIAGFAHFGIQFAMGNDQGEFREVGYKPYFKATEGLPNGSDGWGAKDISKNPHYPRLLGDVNGDGKTDIVGVGHSAVYVGLGHDNGITEPVVYLEQTSRSSSGGRSWRGYGGWGSWGNSVSTILPGGFAPGRDVVTLGDINGDARADIIAFLNDGVYIAYSEGDRFRAFSRQTTAFAGSNGWDHDHHPRFVVDLNGDGKSDLIGFADSGTYVALSTDRGFTDKGKVLAGFGQNRYPNTHDYPRTLADVNGDGSVDIVGFAAAGVEVALGKGDGTFQVVDNRYSSGYAMPVLEDFGYRQGWRGERHVRTLADINGDGRSDLVGFKDDGVYVALASPLQADTRTASYYGQEFTYQTYSLFNRKQRQIAAFGYRAGGWRVDQNPRVMVDVDGNGSADILGFGHRGVEVAQNRFQGQLPRLVSVIDGFGNKTEVDYASLADRSVYQPQTGASYPVLNLNGGAHYLVSEVRTDNGLGGQRVTRYRYGGLKAHLRGRGSLGFAWTETEQLASGRTSRTEYSQTYPHIGLPAQTRRWINGHLLSETIDTHGVRNQWNNRVHFPYVSRSVEKTWELNGNRVSTVTRENRHLDAYGNFRTLSVSTEGGGQRFTQTTRSTYDNHSRRWHLGRLREASVTHEGYGQTQTRRSTFAYHNTTGLLTEEVVQPGHAKALTTRYRHDRFGNRVETTLSGQGLSGRRSQTGFDQRGQFATRTTNALGHTETRRYDARFGVMTHLTGPNQLTTEWLFDRFGRRVGERRADETATLWTRQWARDCEVPHPQSVWCLTVETDGAGLSNTQFDKLGRQVRSLTTGFDGRYALVDKQYDPRGRETHVSQPYFDGEPIHWRETRYDDLDRVVEVETEGPEGYPISVRTAYRGLTTTVTNPKGERKITTTDVLGRVVSVTEPMGARVEYRYDALGNLLETRDPEGHVTWLTYDQRGHKIAMDDPAMGQWQYAYNAAGELTWQQDARGQRTELSYDALGRLIRRQEAEGSSEWLYDTAAKGIGKIAQVISNGFSRHQTYDRLGRPSETTTRIDGKTLRQSREYDGVGRVMAVNYPMGFRVEHDYTDDGHLLAVKSPRGLIQDYQRRHIAGLLGEALERIDAAQQKASDYQAAAARYRAKAQHYQRRVNHDSARADAKRRQAVSLNRAASSNAAAAARETRAASVDQAAANKEKARVADTNAAAADLRRAADANQASAVDKLSQARTLDSEAAALERKAARDRTAGHRQNSEAWKDNRAALQLRATAARLHAIADRLEAQARYWQTQADSRYAALKRIAGGVRCFYVWGRRFCDDLGAVTRKAYQTATSNARYYIDQASAYRQQAATEQAQANRKAHEANQLWQSSAALSRQSAHEARQATSKRQQADRLQTQAAGQQRRGQWQDNRAGYLERTAAPTNRKVARLQAQADQHTANARMAQDTANSQRTQAQQTRADAVPLDQRARDSLANVNAELEKAEFAVANAERYAKEIHDLEQIGDHYQALLGDEDYAVFWRTRERDAAGRLTGVVHGNGLTTTWSYNQATGTLDRIETGLLWENLRELEYQYDNNSNVIRRHDLTHDIEETFHYDRLDRLSLSSVSSNTDPTEAYNNHTTYEYDLSGNLTYKSDVGHYQYDNLQPYRLVSAGRRHSNYRYDANGNVTSGGERSFIWSSFNKPTRMRKGDARVDFRYDPERHRYKRTDTLDGKTTTLYLGKHYEEITTGGHTTHKYFIYAGDQLAAIHVDEVDNQGNQSDYQTRYLHTDALGSVDLITDGTGQIVDRLSFDPFGKRRGANWKHIEDSLQTVALAPVLTNRGFTGHEHIDAVGIIHMNGRIYDPQLGRFLSADPTMQHPYSSQGQNRYAYVQNNPLKYVDMSGFGFFSKLWKGTLWKGIKKILSHPLARIAVAAVAAYFTAGAVLSSFGHASVAAATAAGETAALVTAGAVGGGAFGFIASGGDLKAALTGAITGAAFAYVGNLAQAGNWDGFEKALAQGGVGGAGSELGGGRFKDGFVGAFFAAAVNPLIKDIKSIEMKGALRTLAGGTASRLGGGKFASGATSAAMGFLFNDVLHEDGDDGSAAQEKRNINPQPGGADGPRITFNNDVPGGLSTNLPVDPDLAIAIEDSVVVTGLNVNINSTTGGHSSGPHVEGRAADINRINGLRVDNPLNVDNVRTLQEALINHSNTNQVLGPVLNVNKWHNAPQPSPSLINHHRDHIHINVPR